MNCLVRDVQRLVKTGSGLFLAETDVSAKNQEFISYMLGVMQSYPYVDGFYVGTEQGHLLAVTRLASTHETQYLSDPAKPLPKEAVYGLTVITDKDKWYYVDASQKVVGEETLPKIEEDPRTRPWYIGAKTEGELFWSDIYTYYPSKLSGITASQPIFDEKGKMIAVVGADLTLGLLQEFLAKQQIGENGKAFLLGNAGEPIIVSGGGSITPEDVSSSYSQYLKLHSKDFIYKKNNEEYIASVHSIPVSPHKQWSVLIIAPLIDFFGEMEKDRREVTWISLLILIVASILVVIFARRISVPIVRLAEEVSKIKKLNFESEITVKSNIKEIKMMSSAVIALRSAIRFFGHYVPKEIVDQLIRKGKEIKLGGEKKEVVIFFSDVNGFTSIAETLSPDSLISVLYAYFDGLSKIILDAEGTIDKYLGDNIMAFWGAPLEGLDNAGKACKAALLCQDFLLEFNKREKDAGRPELLTRIGIHFGNVIVGNIGTEERMNYTIIGNAVNFAFKLQEMNKIYQTKILISEAVLEKIPGRFVVRFVDKIELKGEQKKIAIFELVAINPNLP